MVVWSLEFYPFGFKSGPDWLETKIRWSIFFITSVCAGLPALVWSVSDIIHHRKNGHRISIFIILLLLTDFTEIFLDPYILIKLLLNEISCFGLDLTCRVYKTLWWAMKDCGFLLNQLVALEGILSVKYPRFTASVFSSFCFRIVYILVLICVIICHFFAAKLFWVTLLIVIVSVISWIIFCGASCFLDRHSHTSMKSDRHILVIFIFTLLLFYLPYYFCFLICHFLHINCSIVSFIPIYVLSLRLISDPLLCVLVCRQNLSLQTSQNPEGLV